MIQQKEISQWDLPDGYDMKTVPELTRRNFEILLKEHNKLVSAFNESLDHLKIEQINPKNRHTDILRNSVMKNIILCDVDGVVLDWTSKLPEFFVHKGLDPSPVIRAHAWGEDMSPSTLTNMSHKEAYSIMEEYNSSKYIMYLTPYKDALQVVNLLKKEFDFIAVTAIGHDPKSAEMRLTNLNFWFPGAFSKVEVVGIEDSKESILSKYKRSIFIDDSPQHSATGKKVGHFSIRIMRDSRLCMENTITAKNWHEIGCN